MATMVDWEPPIGFDRNRDRLKITKLVASKTVVGLGP